MSQVHGQVKFVGVVLTVMGDYQRVSQDVMRSADVEAAILTRIGKAAAEHLRANPDGIGKRVAQVYNGFRPGSSRAPSMPQFQRLSHMLAFCEELIAKIDPLGDESESLSPDAPVQHGVPVQQLSVPQVNNTPERTEPSVPPLRVPPMGSRRQKE
jgi:hypothetical protein